MPQVKIYLDGNTLERVRANARKEGCSVSKWIRARVDKAVNRDWPPGYFDLFGCLKDVDIERHGQGSFAQDVRRAKL